jgi:hypothetical protein
VGSNGDVYVFWGDSTPYGYEQSFLYNTVQGDDIWMRRFSTSTSGVMGAFKEPRVDVVSRSPVTFDDGQWLNQDYSLVCSPAADAAGWLHLAVGGQDHGAQQPPPPGPCDSLDVVRHWEEFNPQIYYVTHDVFTDDSEWGWEIPISQGPAGSRYGRLAFDGENNALQAVWTQYNPETGNLEVVHREGKSVSTSITGSTTWSGIVLLDESVTVESGATLTIEPGTIVYFQSPEPGQSGPLHQLLVQGQLVAEGTPEEPIVFTSTKDSTSGEWAGIGFDLAGCAPGYGYGGCLQPTSSLRHVTIENGSFGLVMKDFCVPDLEEVSFANITNDRHIYLEADAFIARRYWADGVCYSANCQEHVGSWTLGPGTRVVAADSSSHDTQEVGEQGKVDLVVDGKLLALGGPAATDSVWFGPETPSNSTAREWGGLYLSQDSDGSRLEYASIGYAENPVFLYWPDSLTTLSHTRIHHFAETGLWIRGPILLGPGAVVDSCVIERGSGLAGGLGKTGALVSDFGQLSFTGTRIEMTGDVLGVFGGRGLDVHFGQTYCLHPPPGGPRTLFVNRNTLVGPGYGQLESQTSFTGIHAEWLCGASSLQAISFSENLLYDWNTVALDISQCGTMDVTCNRIEYSRRGVEFFRNNGPDGPGVSFRRNWMEIPAGEDIEHVLRTQNARKTWLGPEAYTTGWNEMRTPEDLPFIRENEPGDTHVELPAEENFWYIGGVLQSDAGAVDVEPYITTELAGQENAPRVDVDPLETEVPEFPCVPDSEWEEPGTAARRPEAVLGDGRPGGPAEGLGAEEAARTIPERSDLGPPRPNPTTRGMIATLAVGRTQAGSYEVTVFDVAGRRVARVVDGPLDPGLYETRWEGRDEGGRRVASGIYFLRGTGPGLKVLRKVVVLE